MASSTSRYKDLASDTLIFMIGNFSVKVIQFVLLPLYTASMSTAEYGTAELLNNLNELLYPIICLGIYEALFRFAMDRNVDRKALVSNALLVWMVGSAVVISVTGVLYFSVHYRYAWFLASLLIGYSARMMAAQYARGIGLVKVFAISGVVNVIALFVSVVVMITMLRTGVFGYLGTMIFANVVSLTYLVLMLRKNLAFSRQFDRSLFHKMLRYSLPLVPNSLAWWFNNLANRYVVLFICGNTFAGLFAAASKLPSIINMFTQVFQQSWQISAIKSMDGEDQDRFSTNVFRAFSTGMILVTSIAIAVSDVLALLLLRGSFIESKRYIPLLMFGVLFTSIASFLGAFYTAYMESSRLFSGTVICAAINIVMSVLLTCIFGTFGSVIGSACANVVLVVMRLRDIQRYVKVEYKRTWFVGGLLLLLGQSVTASFTMPTMRCLSLLCCIGLVFFEFFINHNEVVSVFNIFFSKFLKKKN